MAHSGLRFTPCVALAHNGQAVLMEVQASLRLWGGLGRLLNLLQTHWQDFGWQPPDTVRIATAPTARGALWIALSNRTSSTESGGLVNTMSGTAPDAKAWIATLQGLPLSGIPAVQAHQAIFDRMGIRTLGQLDGMPRAGITRRFGRELLQALDAGFGRSPDPYAWISTPATCRLRRELPARAEHHAMIEEALKRSFHELAAWLHARQCGVEQIQIVLHHDDPPPTAFTLGFSSATRDPQRFYQVLHERLARVQLPRPVYETELCANHVMAQPHGTADFLGAGQDAPDALLELMDRLRARLGDDRIQRLRHANDHRPEKSCSLMAAAFPAPRLRESSLGLRDGLLPNSTHRPSWLLTPPTPLAVKQDRPTYHGPLQLLAGPERIETGWWEDSPAHQAQRDYFIARSQHDELLWVFRTPAHAWYLHGFFS